MIASPTTHRTIMPTSGSEELSMLAMGPRFCQTVDVLLSQNGQPRPFQAQQAQIPVHAMVESINIASDAIQIMKNQQTEFGPIIFM